MQPRVTSLSVQNFRVHAGREVVISPTTTLIIGANGSGKTSLIEAVYIGLQGTSFKGSDNDILRQDAPWYRIDVEFGDHRRSVKFDPHRPSGKKQFEIDEKKHFRLPVQSRYPVVLFEPDDLRLIHGSPTRRRAFLDHFIKQLDPLYDNALRRYTRALQQRNSLLKQSSISPDELFVWNVALAKHGAYITEARKKWIEQLNTRLTKVYRDIAGTDDTIKLKYTSANTSVSEQSLLNLLHKNHTRDQALGFTSIGPHRDDFEVYLNTSLAEAVASRGETRSIILALKLIETQLITDTIGHEPVVLLDDVFSELDETRQKRLSRLKNHQIIITSTARPASLKSIHTIKL